MAEAIDIHTHFVPRSIPLETGRNPLWPSIETRDRSAAAVIVGGKIFRVIDSRSWDAERRINDMAADDVDVQVVSPMPELLSHWFSASDADALCRPKLRVQLLELETIFQLHGLVPPGMGSPPIVAVRPATQQPFPASRPCVRRR